MVKDYRFFKKKSDARTWGQNKTKKRIGRKKVDHYTVEKLRKYGLAGKKRRQGYRYACWIN